MWDDPFENFLLKQESQTKDGTPVRYEGIHKTWFGQCWTYHRDTDAMWRIYSPNKDGIRIKTTVRRLLESIYDQNDQFANLKYFIGKVTYHPQKHFKDLVSSMVFTEIMNDNRFWAGTFLKKRTEFKHEKEVRLLFDRTDEANPNSDPNLFSFDIDPNSLFDEATIDPRLDANEAKQRIQNIKALGFPGHVNQSALYKFDIPPLKFE